MQQYNSISLFQLDLSNCEEIGYCTFSDGIYSEDGTTVIFGENLKNIGDCAFAFDTQSYIKALYLKATSPITTCGEEIFRTRWGYMFDGFKIYIPTEEYKTATNWSDYEEYMELYS